MKFTNALVALLPLTGVIAHPERMTAEVAREEAKLVGRTTNKCAAAIEKRKAAVMEKRAQSLYRRRVEAGDIKPEARSMTSPVKRNTLQYQDIQNSTCVLAPDTIWGPYGYDTISLLVSPTLFFKFENTRQKTIKTNIDLF